MSADYAQKPPPCQYRFLSNRIFPPPLALTSCPQHCLVVITKLGIIMNIRHFLAFLCAAILTLSPNVQAQEEALTAVNKLPRGKILMVLTSAAKLGAEKKPTGFWFEEMATPYYILKEAGFEVDLASIKGGIPPIDPRSIDEKNAAIPSVKRFREDKETMRLLRRTTAIDRINTSEYIGVFLPGGHGAMMDFPTSKVLSEVVGGIWQAGGVLGAVCHGPAGLLSAKTNDKELIIKNKRINSFTNNEEDIVQLSDSVPFMLEDRIKELGGRFEKSVIPFRSFAVRDGRLVTGQNPASSEQTAKLMIEALKDAGF